MAEVITAAQTALALKQTEIVNVISGTQSKITELIEKQELHLPSNYSAGNALKAAQLIIMDIPDIEQCTRQSIANAVLSMAVQGLNPIKKQCYFIKRGNKLTLDPSYFGKVALAERIDPTIEKIIAMPVRRGEVFTFSTNLDGTHTITNHQQTLESMDSKDFIAGYATIIYKGKKENVSEVMTFERIKKSWAMSSAAKDKNGNPQAVKTHEEFGDEMIKRTLLSHITKNIINQSDDGDLLHQMIEATELDTAEAISVEIISRNANQQPLIDVIIDEETGEIYDNDTIVEQSDTQPVETQQEPLNEVTEIVLEQPIISEQVIIEPQPTKVTSGIPPQAL